MLQSIAIHTYPPRLPSRRIDVTRAGGPRSSTFLYKHLSCDHHCTPGPANTHSGTLQPMAIHTHPPRSPSRRIDVTRAGGPRSSTFLYKHLSCDHHCTPGPANNQWLSVHTLLDSWEAPPPSLILEGYTYTCDRTDCRSRSSM
jgi:hypothetical protein